MVKFLKLIFARSHEPEYLDSTATFVKLIGRDPEERLSRFPMDRFGGRPVLRIGIQKHWNTRRDLNEERKTTRSPPSHRGHFHLKTNAPTTEHAHLVILALTIGQNLNDVSFHQQEDLPRRSNRSIEFRIGEESISLGRGEVDCVNFQMDNPVKSVDRRPANAADER